MKTFDEFVTEMRDSRWDKLMPQNPTTVNDVNFAKKLEKMMSGSVRKDAHVKHGQFEVAVRGGKVRVRTKEHTGKEYIAFDSTAEFLAAFERGEFNI
ncbi:hypothetical protein VPFG_00371 [Vibrio phage nt-1]|uniref:Uncharacterized protein n=1 Tax=Vibrio phage nt-1 TaxID=115992 RepID=R9TGZ1_9CAUD|nr:hypothetical protein VPFG_00371 [Vibrio phage nt-1]AGN30368.1 hypothetical protein VPFG_00371 [Vibrio phage nt-1]